MFSLHALVPSSRNKLESFFVPYSDVIVAPRASYSRWILGLVFLVAVACLLLRFKKYLIPDETGKMAPEPALTVPEPAPIVAPLTVPEPAPVAPEPAPVAPEPAPLTAPLTVAKPERVYPEQPLERLGVKLKDIMLEEGVSPQIVANAVAFVVRSVLHGVHTVKPIEKREPEKREPEKRAPEKRAPDAKRTIIPDLPSTRPKRKSVILGPIVEEVVVKGENPRLKKLLESRERMEEEMRSKGALDPKDPLKP